MKSRPEHIKLTNKPKLIVSKELQSQILYFHSLVGNIEWSGPLFFSVVEGSVEDLDNFVIKAEIMLPKDVGSPSYTQYTIGPEVFDFYDRYPIADPSKNKNIKLGHIHTHHSMSTFFSGTDESELYDNSPKHNYYVSLIVNHVGKYCAKVAIYGNIEKTVEYTGANGDKHISKLGSKEVMMSADFDVELEADDFMKKEIISLIEASRKAATPVVHYRGVSSNYRRVTTNYFDEDDEKWAKRVGAEIEEEEVGSDERYEEIKAFLPKVISLNPKTVGDLDSVIETIDKRLATTDLVNEYVIRILNSIQYYYDTHFKPKAHDAPETFEDFIMDCSLVLDEYRLYNNLADVLSDTLEEMFNEKQIGYDSNTRKV